MMPTAKRSAAATQIYVSTYSGAVITLNLHKQEDHTYNLEHVATHDCGATPSWLDLDDAQHTLICVDEGLDTPHGSLTCYRREPLGKLNRLATTETIAGPVSSVFYNSNTAVALAHYSGSAISTFSIADDSTLAPLQNFAFALPRPGPVANRQEASHPHQVILDPTGRFVGVPDLGADALRIFRIDPATNLLSELESFMFAPGSGPRHAVFWSPSGVGAGNSLYLHVVTELANSLVSYAVTYPGDGSSLALEKVFETNTFGGGAIPAGAAVAEIDISPDNQFLIVSNRNDSSFRIPHPDAEGVTEEPSDSLAMFRIQHGGSLDFMQLSPAGGKCPRHFSFNKSGDLVAVGLQFSHRVVIFSRDVDTGKLGDAVAWYPANGEVTSMIWGE